MFISLEHFFYTLPWGNINPWYRVVFPKCRWWTVFINTSILLICVFLRGNWKYWYWEVNESWHHQWEWWLILFCCCSSGGGGGGGGVCVFPFFSFSLWYLFIIYLFSGVFTDVITLLCMSFPASTICTTGLLYRCC